MLKKGHPHKWEILTITFLMFFLHSDGPDPETMMNLNVELTRLTSVIPPMPCKTAMQRFIAISVNINDVLVQGLALPYFSFSSICLILKRELK